MKFSNTLLHFTSKFKERKQRFSKQKREKDQITNLEELMRHFSCSAIDLKKRLIERERERDLKGSNFIKEKKIKHS